ncbi:MAG: N-acetyltransferase [Alphaproteobacteria bacterium]|nr:N-acetyltransferase [Alphaproteobacteria bacterium]
MNIRQEKASEFPVLYELIKTAFQTAQVSSGTEQDFANRLRASGNYIPDLALVAEEDGKIVGHIMLTHTFSRTPEGSLPLLLLAPVSVVLEQRNKGVGKALIAEAFRRAKEAGHAAIVLVGNPDYYSKFGFTSSADFGIRNANGIPDQYVMACELVPGALGGIQNATITFET